MDYEKDMDNILKKSCDLAVALSQMERMLNQFEKRLGDFSSDLITHKTTLHAYVNGRIHDDNSFNKNTSDDHINQFKAFLELYTPGQGFVDFKSLPTYALMDKTALSSNKYRKYLTKSENIVELFEHYFSFLLSNKIVQYKWNSKIMKADSFSYHVPQQFIPLFCASIVSLCENKGGGVNNQGPIYNVAESFLHQSKNIIDDVSFRNLMKGIKLNDPVCAELFFCWNTMVFYKSYKIGSVLFREQFGITDRTPAENYVTNFCYSLEKRLCRELPESAGCVQVLVGRLKPLLFYSYNTLYFDLCLLLLADYLKYVLNMCSSDPSSEQHKSLCAERFKNSIESFAARLLSETWTGYTDTTVSSLSSLSELQSELNSTKKIILDSALYRPEHLPLLAMFDYYKTNTLEISNNI